MFNFFKQLSWDPNTGTLVLAAWVELHTEGKVKWKYFLFPSRLSSSFHLDISVDGI